MNWLITGGCGFIGSSLTARLLREGHRIRILDNLTVGTRAALPKGIAVVERDPGEVDDQWGGLELVVADIRDRDATFKAVRGAGVIVHLAANTGVIPSIESPREDCEVNVFGTLNLLEAARLAGVPRFVFASSGAPLGEQEPPLHEELAPHPISPYGASKLAGEGYCSAYWGSFGIETVALRFGNVYGPGSAAKQSVVAKFIKQALAGEQLVIYGDGSQTRDFIYIDDIVEAIVRSGTRPEVAGHVLQIATQREHTVNEVAQLISKGIEDRTRLQVRIAHDPPRPGEVVRNYSDVSKARARLGFEPRVSLDDGIERTIEYFLDHTSATGR